MYTAIGLGLVAVFGVGVAANTALPGDVLYPVKVNVNEELRSSAMISTEAQAKWDAERVRRRVQEMVTLSAEGKLDAEAKAEAEAEYEKCARHAKERAAELRAEGDTEAALEIETELQMISLDFDADVNADVSAGLEI